MHNSTVSVLLVVAVDVKHEAELLHARAQVNRLGLAATKFEANKVAFAEHEVAVDLVAGLFPREGAWVNPQLKQLLPQITKE